MKVLITGSNGQLGSEIKKIMEIRKTELGKIPDVFENADVMAAGANELDITKYDDVLNVVLKFAPHVIINCAAYTNVDACETNKDVAFSINALGPRNLAIAAHKIEAQLIHISTDYVFSGNGNTPYSEYDICCPNSVYGHTKHLGEKYVRDFCKRHFIVRTSWLYGYVGENFVKTILNTAKEKGSLKVVNDQRGTPTNAADLAHHIMQIAATKEYGIYHCAGKEECSWYEFAKEIIALSGLVCEIKPCTTDEFPRPARRPAYSSLDNCMLRCTVGDNMRTWQQSIREYMLHYDKEKGEIVP